MLTKGVFVAHFDSWGTLTYQLRHRTTAIIVIAKWLQSAVHMVADTCQKEQSVSLKCWSQVTVSTLKHPNQLYAEGSPTLHESITTKEVNFWKEIKYWNFPSSGEKRNAQLNKSGISFYSSLFIEFLSFTFSHYFFPRFLDFFFKYTINAKNFIFPFFSVLSPLASLTGTFSFLPYLLKFLVSF